MERSLEAAKSSLRAIIAASAVGVGATGGGTVAFATDGEGARGTEEVDLGGREEEETGGAETGGTDTGAVFFFSDLKAGIVTTGGLCALADDAPLAEDDGALVCCGTFST